MKQREMICQSTVMTAGFNEVYVKLKEGLNEFAA